MRVYEWAWRGVLFSSYNNTSLLIRLRPRDYHSSSKPKVSCILPLSIHSLSFHHFIHVSKHCIGHLLIVLKRLCRLVDLNMEIKQFKLVWRKLRSTRSKTLLEMLPTQELFEYQMNSKQTNRYRHTEVATDQQLQPYKYGLKHLFVMISYSNVVLNCIYSCRTGLLSRDPYHSWIKTSTARCLNTYGNILIFTFWLIKTSENPYISSNDLTFETQFMWPLMRSSRPCWYRFKYDIFCVQQLTPIFYSSYITWYSSTKNMFLEYTTKEKKRAINKPLVKALTIWKYRMWDRAIINLRFAVFLLSFIYWYNNRRKQTIFKACSAYYVCSSYITVETLERTYVIDWYMLQSC